VGGDCVKSHQGGQEGQKGQEGRKGGSAVWPPSPALSVPATSRGDAAQEPAGDTRGVVAGVVGGRCHRLYFSA
jgi:hypothetical protein